MLRLPSGLPQVGVRHRSGWPYALRALAPLLSRDGLLLDDFVERTFLRRHRVPQVWEEPWIGISHHPPNLPSWAATGCELLRLLDAPGFQASLPHLRALIVLSQHAAAAIRPHLDVPVIALRHPSEEDAPRFDVAAYAARPTLLQVGWFCRCQDAITQVPVPLGTRKVRIDPGSETADRQRRRMKGRGADGEVAPVWGATEVLPRQSAAAYDALLASSVVFGEYLDASASNTVLECLARYTPIVLNRLPAHEEYLGRDYPLFYEDRADVRRLVRLPQVQQAHRYLRRRPRPWLDGATWRAAVAEVVRTVQEPVCS